MSTRKKILRNVFSNWAILAVHIVISFFLAPFIVRSLGNTYYGIWVIMMQFTGYLYLLDFGIRESIIRYVSKHKASGVTSDLNEIISSGFLLYLAIGALCLVITGILALLFPYVFNISEDAITTARIVVLLSGLTIAQGLAFNVFGGILAGLQRYDILNKIGIVFAFVRVALIVFFLKLGFSIIALASIQLLVSLVNNIFVYIYTKKLMTQHDMPFAYTRTPLKERYPIFKKLYHYSKYVLINNLGQKAIFYTDALIIGIMLSAASVTFYAIAGNLIDYLRKIILQTNDVLNPVASGFEASNEHERIIKLLLNGSKYSMTIALPVCVIYMTVGDHFINLWMGEEYAALSGKILFLLTFTTLVTMPHITISSILYGISKHNIISNLRIYEAISNLVLSIVLALKFGIIGVALGTAIPQIIFMGIVLPIIISNIINLSILEYIIEAYAKPFIAVVPFYLTYFLINNYYPANNLFIFFIQIFMAMPVYVVSSFIFCLDKTDKDKALLFVKRKFNPSLL